MIMIITGNGKGKTTSAIGTAIRSLGWKKKTAIIFFDKGGGYYGEQKIFDLLKDLVDIYRFGEQRFDEKNQTFRFENTEDDKEEASKAIKKAKELIKEGYFTIICDEIINTMNSGLISQSEVKHLINDCHPNTHFILTGRNAPKWLIDMANLVSEVKEVKHYYKEGTKAIKGIDF